MTATVVLGGGLTGLVAARHLEAAGHPVTILEKEATPGGACRTERSGPYHFDYTGHLLHVGRDETRTFFKDLGLWSALTEHVRRAAIHLGGSITPYPIQIHTWGLPPTIRRDCLLGFIQAWADHDRPPPERFSEWVLDRFGAGLARHFFFPYNEKLFRCPPENLTLDWVGRYVPKPELEAVVDGALGLHDEQVGYNARFWYPTTGGIRLLPDGVADGLAGLRLSTECTAVHLGERWAETAGGERVPWTSLVSTIALPFLVDRLVDAPPPEVLAARKALRWVSVLNIALGVRGPAPRPEHWFYFPETKFPFYRVGFPSNHGHVAPDGAHTISIEISLSPGERVGEAVVDGAESALAGIGLLERERIETRRVTVLNPAYVVFDPARREAVHTLRRYFSEHGVMLSGRWAEWKYSAMEDAVLDGTAVARRLQRSNGA